MSLEIGAVREGRDGKRYTFLGGDEKAKSSWQEVKAAPTAEEPSVLKDIEGAGKLLMKLNPLYFGASQVGKAVSPENAYEAGGKVTDFGAKIGLPPEVAAGAGYLTDVGIQSVPTILSGNIVKAGSESITKPAARWAMTKAVKAPREAQLSGDAAKAVETMLKEGVNVSSGGMKKLAGEVNSLSAQVDDLINAAEKSGATVSKMHLLKSFREELKKIAAPLDSGGDVEQARGVLQRVLADPRFKELDDIPVRMAQDLKTSTYRSLGEKAYNQADNMTTSKVNSLKSIVRGLKEGIEEASPAVQAPNKRMQELLNAIEVVEPRALMSGNQNFGGLSYLAENLPAAGGFLLDRSALANSILGRFLYSGAPSVLGNTARLGYGVGAGMAQP